MTYLMIAIAVLVALFMGYRMMRNPLKISEASPTEPEHKLHPLFILYLESIPLSISEGFDTSWNVVAGGYGAGALVALDERKKQILVIEKRGGSSKPNFFRGDWSKIISAEVRQNQKVIEKATGIGALPGAIVGGVALGGVGMVAGAVIGKKGRSTTQSIETDLYITLNDSSLPSVKLAFGKDDTLAFEWMARLDAVMRTAKDRSREEAYQNNGEISG
ncbi:MAG: hypothetical protein E6Q98_16175 [Rhodospirillaceae bacterium]|nr:MAG: hypothetical protein E6Q98_16175 [Rhodospirillaceae bacterium]